MSKTPRKSGDKPLRPYRGARNEDLGVPFALTDALSRAAYNELVYNLPSVVAGLPYVVLHERDPRGIVSTFEMEDGERYQLVLRRASAEGYPTGVEDAEGLRRRRAEA